MPTPLPPNLSHRFAQISQQFPAGLGDPPTTVARAPRCYVIGLIDVAKSPFCYRPLALREFFPFKMAKETRIWDSVFSLNLIRRTLKFHSIPLQKTDGILYLKQDTGRTGSVRTGAIPEQDDGNRIPETGIRKSCEDRKRNLSLQINQLCCINRQTELRHSPHVLYRFVNMDCKILKLIYR